MSTKRQGFSAAAALVLACGLTLGQGIPGESADKRQLTSPPAMDHARSEGVLRATTLIGSKVVNANGETIGNTADLILTDSGRVAFGLLSHGGVAGVGDELVAVPWSMYQHRLKDDQSIECVVPLTKTQFEAAPSFKADEWAIVREQSWLNKTYDALGVDPEWNKSDRGYREHWTTGTETKVKGTVTAVDRRSPGRGMTDALVVTVREESGAERQVVLGPAWFVDTTGRPILVGDKIEATVVETTVTEVDPRMLAREAKIGTSRLDLYDKDKSPYWDAWDSAGPKTDTPTYVRASTLLGSDLKASDGEVAGSIDDLVIRHGDSYVTLVALTYGGVLGVGDARTAVPWSLVRIDNEGHASLQAGDRGKVRSSPVIESADWTRLNDPTFRATIYSHFGVEEPRWAGQSRLSTEDMLTGWERNSDYNRQYPSGRESSLTGVVLSIDRKALGEKMSEGACMTIQASEGQRTVHLGPAWYLDHQPMPKEGDTVTVNGVMVEGADPRDTYIIASKVTTPHGTMYLRDKDGSPRWDQTAKE